ncbi:MAG: hypothetical protein WA051_03205 [Minisyncoccia bacterium]
MEPKFQTSFIPKTQSQQTAVPREVEAASGPRESGGIWSLIANGIFTISIIAAIAVFGGQWYLNRSLASMGDALTNARNELEPERIQEINRAFDRINAAKGLLANHVMLSNFLDKFQSITVKNLRLTDFDFNMLSGKGITIGFRGEALGYVSVAEQADIFSKQTFFRNSSFYDLDLNENGAVLFSYKAELDPAVISSPQPVENTQ